tara:strand:- start:2325 stop:3497 length:1173 start_codon:yes stop_codon:yes gene_type:complete
MTTNQPGGASTLECSDRPLRIVINGTHAKSGGGVTYLRRILPELAQQPGFELHLFLHQDQMELFYPVCDGVQLTLFDHNPGFWSTLRWEQFSLPVIAWAMGADAVFSPANYGPVFARNHVILLRNATSVITLTTRLRPMAYWMMLSGATFVSLLLAKRAIAVSEYAARILTFGLRRLFRRKLNVVYHGTSTPPRFRANNAEPGVKLLAVSDIYVQKNYHSLIKAFAEVLKKRPDLTLTIVGREIDSYYADSIRSIVVERNLVDAVRFLGYVGPSELNTLYKSCHIFVFPSTVETFGNPLLEAMSFGVPIACSNTAAMPEVIGDAGLTFDPRDTEDIARKIEMLLSDQALRASLGEKAARRALDFSLEHTAKRTAQVLRSAAAADLLRPLR